MSAEDKSAEVARLIVERMGGECVIENPNDEVLCHMIKWSNGKRWQWMTLGIEDLEDDEPTPEWIADYFVERYWRR